MSTPAMRATSAAHGPAVLTTRLARISPRRVVTFPCVPSRSIAVTLLPRRKRPPTGLALARAPRGGDVDVADAGLQRAQLVGAQELGLDTATFLECDLALQEFDIALVLRQHQAAADLHLEILSRI